MKKIYIFLLTFLNYSFSQQSSFIHVDQFGYKPNSTKVAVISSPEIGFNSNLNYTPGNTFVIKNSTDNAVVYTGSISQWNNGNIHSQSGDKGWWFDFTDLNTPGTYYIEDTVTNEKSAEFEINANVYENIINVATKMFYYNRANIAKTSPFVDTPYVDAISFTKDQFARYVYDQDNTNTEKDMRGGWFDAGDNNKYVTFTESAVHDLLWSYRLYPNAFTDNFNIPESGNSVPDIIDEIKWEMDWVLKMINTDGSVHIKVGNRNYNENVNTPPSSNSDTRYYADVCTSSALAASSMLAHASKVFEQFPSLQTYATTLKDKAELTWEWVLPYLNDNTLQLNCDDGSVVAGDADRTEIEQRRIALTAAIYLFDLTSKNEYNQYVINHINDTPLINNNQWDNYLIKDIDALLHYSKLPNGNSAIQNQILTSASNSVNNNDNDYFMMNNLDLYRGYSNDWTYHWGSNSARAAMANLNLIFKFHDIDYASNETYVLRAKEILHYFHGVNPLGLVYLSNMESFGAENSIKELYHFWFQDGSQ